MTVDVAIDQGGCVETSKPTTHSNPTFIVDNVVHYCVANMPGAVGRTSTFALCNVTLPWILKIANNLVNYEDNLLNINSRPPGKRSWLRQQAVAKTFEGKL